MMNKEFVSYDLALALKELGFNEESFGHYRTYGKNLFYATPIARNLPARYRVINAPLYQQAFRWFREKYNLVIQYIPHELDNEENESILYHKYKISEYDSWRGGRRNTIESELCDTYEEAELACLKKLIEIVKNK